jgi:aspartate aminotransferase
MIQWVSDRTKDIKESASVNIADKVRDLKRLGQDIIELQTGDPDFPTPPHIVQAAYEAMQMGFTHYVSSRGIPELRAAISEKLWNDNKIKASAESEILVTPGAIHAVNSAIAATINPGDEVIIPDPCWVAYQGTIALYGGLVVRLTGKTGTLKVDIDRLEKTITPRTKMLILNYPSNPMGTILSFEDLKQIAGIAIRYNLLVLADEIYEKIIYDGNRHLSIASLDGMRDRTITVNGFSKSYAMTGWRIGYVAANSEIISEMLKVQQYSVTCAGSFVQKAALAALKGSQDCVTDMVKEYDRRRRMIINWVKDIKCVSCINPEGAFYAFMDFSRYGLSSIEISDFLLTEGKVGVVPGSSYGPSGEGYVRISFATSYENLIRALDRIGNVIKKWGR